jgi:hypothetical protein
MTSLDHKIATTAARQHGLITRAQALLLGMSSAQIQRRRSTGRWIAVESGVYLIHGAPFTWHTRVMTACLATGGMASHRTAAALLQTPDFRPGRPEVTVPRSTRVHTNSWRVHQSTDLHLVQPILVAEIPTTPVDRLAVDLGSVVPFAVYEKAIDALVARNQLTWDRMLRTLLAHARRGRNGVGALRALLLERYGDDVSTSALERAFAEIFRHVDLPLPLAEHSIYDALGFIARVDFAYPKLRIAIELDSKRHHLHATAFEEDRRKRNRLKLAGWFVLEFTWKMVIEQPLLVIRQIEQAIATQQSLLG